MNTTDRDYIGTHWTPEDVQHHYPWLHLDECDVLLGRHADQLQEGMVTAGWEIIYDFPNVRPQPEGWCACEHNRSPVVLCIYHQTRAEKNYPQGWQYYPGDTCQHHVYVGGVGIDLMCGPCEMGED